MPMRVVAAPDKFKGTASAAEAAQAMCEAALQAGWECDPIPLADGGEGTLEVLGGPNRNTLVSGPLGDPVRAPWRIRRGQAIIEMAAASGLTLIGEPHKNDPISASTQGTGELISAAVEAGAKKIVVTLGGSATTDGGLGAIQALPPLPRLKGIELVVAVDVTTKFLDAAAVFGPQKGATTAQVKFLRRRLERLAQLYKEEYGVDVTELPGSGAAGGLAGALAAIGAKVVSGFEVVAEEVGLVDALGKADLVITGEGFLDAASFQGKVVGGVAAMANDLSVPAVAIAGAVYDEIPPALNLKALSLSALYGKEQAHTDVLGSIRDAALKVLTNQDFFGPPTS